MVFRPELVKLIRKGRKTMTRRPVKPGPLGSIAPCRYSPDRSYAVQPSRGAKETCRIAVQAVRRERLGDITYQDARAEGFQTTQGFLDYWRDLYGSVDLDQQVWVITFRLGEPEIPVFLAGQNHQADYTFNKTKAARGEPEVTDEAAVTRFTAQSRANAVSERREHQLRRQARTLQQRLREAAIGSGREGVDITENLARIHRELEDIEQRRQAARAA